MVTLATGQLIYQTAVPGRIWKLTTHNGGRGPDSRWGMILVEPGEHRDGASYRVVGDSSATSERWLRDNCIDVPNIIAAPCGDGIQTVAYQILDSIVSVETVETAEEAIAFFERAFQANDDFGMGLWYGYDATPGDTAPDLTVTVDADTLELVWAEA